jgi:hypothetical protein
MEKNLLKVKMMDGTEVQIPAMSLVLQVWDAGEWKNHSTYPNTQEGFDKANEVMYKVPWREARIEQFF